MSTEAGTAEGTGPPDRLLEDSTSEDTAESVYRRERELESTSSKPVIPTVEVTVIKLGRGGSDTGGVGEGGSLHVRIRNTFWLKNVKCIHSPPPLSTCSICTCSLYKQPMHPSPPSSSCSLFFARSLNVRGGGLAFNVYVEFSVATNKSRVYTVYMYIIVGMAWERTLKA